MSRRGRRTRPDREVGANEVAAWQAWLNGTGEPPAAVTPAAESARALVHDDTAAIPAVTGPLAIALARALREAPGRLIRCAEQGARELAKAARRELHELRRRRVAVPDPERPAADPEPRSGEPATYVSDESWGVLTAPFNDGERLLAFRFRVVAGSGLAVGLAAFSEQGLFELDLYEGNARLFRETTQRCVEQVPGAQIPFARCLFVLERAADRGREKGHPPPKGYRDLQHLLGLPWTGDPEHPAVAIQVGPPPDPTEQAALFDLPELKHWVPPRALWPEIERRFQEVAESKLVLDATQHRARIDGVIDWATAECFAPPLCPDWAERLADAAWVAAARRRGPEAAQLMALREQISRPGFDPGTLDFCRFLVIRPGQAPLRPPVEPGRAASPGAEPEPPTLLWTPGQPPSGPEGPGPAGGGGLIVPGR